MITVNRIGDSITGSCNGAPFGIPYTEERYKEMKSLEQASNDAATMSELFDIVKEFKKYLKSDYEYVVEKYPYLMFNGLVGKYFLKLDDGNISKHPLPQKFVDRIIESIDKQIDFEPLIKCWTRFLRNPNYTDNKAYLFANYINKTYTDLDMVNSFLEQGLSKEVAIERATRYQTPITQEGLICTYKVSREITEKWVLENGVARKINRYEAKIDELTGEITYDTPNYVEDRIFEPVIMGTTGDSFFCGDTLGHICKVGQYHRLESWDQVETTDGLVGHKGLHSGNLDYIRGYQRPDTVTHNVFIDPMHIGRFTNEGEGAIVTLGYFIHSSFDGVNRSLYHSSTYAAISDNEYRKMIEEAIELTGKMDIQRLKDLKYMKSLGTSDTVPSDPSIDL